VLVPDHCGYITGLDRHMFDWEWTLNHTDDHGAVEARIDVPMGGVHRNQHGLSSFDGLMFCANDNNPVTLQAKYDFIRDRMAVQAVLLAWLKTVDIAVELVRLPDPFPNETVRREGLQAFERFLFHRIRLLLLIAR
jgi:hypothetical protein